jgi:hypothetical protein
MASLLSAMKRRWRMPQNSIYNTILPQKQQYVPFLYKNNHKTTNKITHIVSARFMNTAIEQDTRRKALARAKLLVPSDVRAGRRGSAPVAAKSADQDCQICPIIS